MSDNVSSSSSDSLLPPNFSSFGSFDICFVSSPSSFIFTLYFITNILFILPFCVIILYLGLRRCQQHPSSSPEARRSHSDSFTFHLVIMELIGVFGSIIISCGINLYRVGVIKLGYSLWSFAWDGEILSQIFTCLECYLAVVHPVMYLSLRSTRGTRIRNICMGSVWLLSCGLIILQTLKNIAFILHVLLLSSAMIIISFCGLSVLWVLIRPGPGKEGRAKRRVEKSKQKAFYTIMVVMGVLLIKFVWGQVMAALFVLSENKCLIFAGGVWCNIPSSLVLPLLFLFRAGLCCKNKGKK